jgi:starch synthase
LIKILHLAAECYPAAKAGGLGDVVGALPKYQQKAGYNTAVVIPLYHLKWMFNQRFEEVHSGYVRVHDVYHSYSIQLVPDAALGFNFYMVHVPGLFDRNGIYADAESGFPFRDEVDRYLVFQQAVLQWVNHWEQLPDIIHCHDHHTGLVPFMMRYCPEFKRLETTPSVFTIHNGQYHGAFSWTQMHKLPYFYTGAAGMLDWANTINPLATGIKCCWKLTTVSPNYLRELMGSANGLEGLFRQEAGKAHGVLNGIDQDVWDPATDPMVTYPFKGDISEFKKQNKLEIARNYSVSMQRPLFTFIGRLVNEKGADLLPDLIYRYLQTGREACFFVLGSGNPWLKDSFLRMRHELFNFFDASIEYNERLAHQLYAGSDFLLMPSRVEPCGLNQMYAFRYGTIPIVRAVGGLWDTVPDAGDPEGRGFRFLQFSVDDALDALIRASNLYYHQTSLDGLRERIMSLDFSWERSAEEYINIYKTISKL